MSLTQMQRNRFVNGRPIDIDFPNNTGAPLSTLQSNPTALKYNSPFLKGVLTKSAHVHVNTKDGVKNTLTESALLRNRHILSPGYQLVVAEE